MPPDPTPAELGGLLQLATTLALESAELLTTGARPQEVAPKSSAVDLVTEFDRRVEAHIVDRLRTARPRDSVFGEEGASHQGTSGVRWLIDPIDGTTNFVYGSPGYAVSVGVEVHGELAAGVVHDVLLRETFAAALGAGATLNGQPIRVSEPADLATALVGTGFSYSAQIRAAQSEALRHILPRVRDIRRRGSAALDLCWVACGRLDAYFERDIGGLWDIAAGAVILREAGGRLEGLHGPPAPPELLLASSRALFEPFRALLLAAHEQ